MPSDVACDLATTGGVAHVDCIFQVKLFGEGGEIIGISVHLVTVPRLGGTTVSSPVMRDDSIAALAQKQHLRIPIVGSEWPAMTEDYGLTLSPVLVENLRTVFC